LKFSRLFCQDKDQDCFFILDMPQDQFLGLEDYVTGMQ